jgi:hypothetical protein
MYYVYYYVNFSFNTQARRRYLQLLEAMNLHIYRNLLPTPPHHKILFHIFSEFHMHGQLKLQRNLLYKVSLNAAILRSARLPNRVAQAGEQTQGANPKIVSCVQRRRCKILQKL